MTARPAKAAQRNATLYFFTGLLFPSTSHCWGLTKEGSWETHLAEGFVSERCLAVLRNKSEEQFLSSSFTNANTNGL